MKAQGDLFSQPKLLTAIDYAEQNPDVFSKDFLKWLPQNTHIWEAFVKEVMKLIARGYTHYSARTILEFLRHHSALHEASSEWKINNNVQPYLARLFDIVYPQHAGLFEYRVTTKEKGNE